MNIYLYKMIGGILHVAEIEVEEKPKTFNIVSTKSIKNECGVWRLTVKKSELEEIDRVSGYSYSMFVSEDSTNKRNMFINKCIEEEKRKIAGFKRKIEEVEKQIGFMEGEFE